MTENNIFISYSRSDSDFVLKLEEDLSRESIFIWLDQKKISGGKLWDRAIEEALGSAGILILVVSSKSALSENVANEVQYAVDEGKKIIPVIIEQTKIPLTWRRYQRIDFIEDYEAGLNNLAQTLKFEMSQKQDIETKKEEQVLIGALDAKAEEDKRIKKQTEKSKKEKGLVQDSAQNIETSIRKKPGYKIPIIVTGVIAVLVIIIFIVYSGNNTEIYPSVPDQTVDSQNDNSEESAWNDAISLNTIEGFKAYQQNFKDEVHLNEAQNKIDEIADKNDWQNASTINTKEAYQEYLQKHANGSWIGDANKKITDLNKLTFQENKGQRIAKPVIDNVNSPDKTLDNVLKAESVKYVEYPIGDSKGTFSQIGSLKWQEKNPDGVFPFDEKARDEWSIYLFDPDRNVTIQLDLYKKEILYEGSLIYYISKYSINAK